MSLLIDQTYLESAFDKRRIAQLANDGSGPKLTVVTDAINAAEAEVMNYLSKQYTVDQLAANLSVQRCVAIVTMYMLELRRSDVSKGIQIAYNAALNYIQSLIDGNAKLNEVPQILPRITQSNAQQLFESSGYFNGMLDTGDSGDVPPDTTSE